MPQTGPIEEAINFSQNRHVLIHDYLIMHGASRYSDYTIATKLQAGRDWHSRSWLCPEPASLFKSTRWFNVKRQLQNWMDGQLFTCHPPINRLFLTRRSKWNFDNCGVIMTPIIHRLEPTLVSPWCSEDRLVIVSEGLAKGSYQKNTQPTVL